MVFVVLNAGKKIPKKFMWLLQGLIQDNFTHCLAFIPFAGEKKPTILFKQSGHVYYSHQN